MRRRTKIFSSATRENHGQADVLGYRQISANKY